VVIDVWRAFARERGWRFSEEPDATLAGRHEGIEIEVHTHRDLAGGWITEVLATPRLALEGTVTVAPARGWRRLLASPGPLPGFMTKSSSESVARAVLDQRVLETLRALGDRLVELEYTGQRIELSWMDTDRDRTTLEEAVACVAYLAVATAQTPYR
jgi:hypothetical protein